MIRLLWNTWVRLPSLESQQACAKKGIHIGWLSCCTLLHNDSPFAGSSRWDMYCIGKHHVPLWSVNADLSPAQGKPRPWSWQGGKALGQCGLQQRGWAWEKPRPLPSLRRANSMGPPEGAELCQQAGGWRHGSLGSVPQSAQSHGYGSLGSFPSWISWTYPKIYQVISINVACLFSSVTKTVDVHCFLCEECVLFSCMLNSLHVSVFVELERHLANLQLYIIFPECIFVVLGSRGRWHLGVICESRRRSNF